MKRPRNLLPLLTLLALLLAIFIDVAEAASLRESRERRSPVRGTAKANAKEVESVQLHQFCYRYRLACIQAASADKTSWADEAVTFSCSRSKSNAVFSVGCRFDGQDYSSAALTRLATLGWTGDAGGAPITSVVQAVETAFAIAIESSTETQTTTASTTSTVTEPDIVKVTSSTTDISTETVLTSFATSTATETIPLTLATTTSLAETFANLE